MVKFTPKIIIYCIILASIYILYTNFISTYPFPLIKLLYNKKEQLGSILLLCISILLILFLSYPTIITNTNERKALFHYLSSTSSLILLSIFYLWYLISLKNWSILESYDTYIRFIFLFIYFYFFYLLLKQRPTLYGQGINDAFNIKYERIRILLIFFLFIFASISSFIYPLNNTPSWVEYFYINHSWTILTFILIIFTFIYSILLLSFTNTNNDSNTSINLIEDSFSSYGKWGLIFTIITVIITSVIILITPSNESIWNKLPISFIFGFVAIVCFLLSALQQYHQINNQNSNNKNIQIAQLGISYLFGTTLIILFVIWIISLLQRFIQNPETLFQFIFYFLIFILISYFFYRISFTLYNRPITFNILSSNIYYIIFIITIILCYIYWQYHSLQDIAYNQGGQIITQGPISLNNKHTYGTLEIYQGSLDTTPKGRSRFAISLWIFLDTTYNNEIRTKDGMIFNFGNRPCIMYRPGSHLFYIKMLDRIIYENDQWLYQKWNHIVINSLGGTMDIFLNSKLVATNIDVVPYYLPDEISIGEDDGMNGGICNVLFFSHSLKLKNIQHLYNHLRWKNPPIPYN